MVVVSCGLWRRGGGGPLPALLFFVCLCFDRFQGGASQVCKFNEDSQLLSERQPLVHGGGKQFAPPDDAAIARAGIAGDAGGTVPRGGDVWHQAWDAVEHYTLDLSPDSLTRGVTFDIVQHYQVSPRGERSSDS